MRLATSATTDLPSDDYTRTSGRRIVRNEVVNVVDRLRWQALTIPAWARVTPSLGAGPNLS